MGSPGVSRRVLLVGAGVALAGCAQPSPRIIRPTASLTGPVRQRLDAIMATYGRNPYPFGVAIRDLRSNADYDHEASYLSNSASMAKPMIVAMALRASRARGGEMSYANYTRASKAIIVSDNDAADELWAFAGGPDAYQRLANELGMKQTRRDPVKDFWSWTWTTPADQRLLMDKLLLGTPALRDDDRFYLLDLMSKVVPEQSWGVGHPRSADVRVQMKNGWVQFVTGDGLWAVNSTGHVEGEGRDYVATLMCRTPTFPEGRRFIDGLGADIWAAMAGRLT